MDKIVESLRAILRIFWDPNVKSRTWFDRIELTFAAVGEDVYIRTNARSRYFLSSGNKVRKSDIVRIQKNHCLTLFTKSNNTIDIRINVNDAVTIYNEAKKVFPNAEFVEIE
jgi:hypothetical protein